MSVLESEESYVNILLGDYEEPEVYLEIESWKMETMTKHQSSGLPEKVLSLQLCGSLPWIAVHQ